MQEVLRRFAFDTICQVSLGMDPSCLDLSKPPPPLAVAFDARVCDLRHAGVGAGVRRLEAEEAPERGDGEGLGRCGEAGARMRGGDDPVEERDNDRRRRRPTVEIAGVRDRR
ncbi:cytochrome p450 94b1 [Phtheirospermum japonicum]|uniref:Cytochrome p450 94b1 n=1 Tax=Phtheirospermum japonicum TaxID=374723 RepID=A0A830B663_9LAMI|nr:cytochrome p450 94b1 [Phtheirospermum japonicum]